MIPESKLKADCTPEIIKKMCELAEGFKHPILIPDENDTWERQINLIYDTYLFPLLIHRAVEGWNKTKGFIRVFEDVIILKRKTDVNTTYLYFKDYQPSSLTPCECACLHCLIEVLG
jgi:hypothetical protein